MYNAVLAVRAPSMKPSMKNTQQHVHYVKRNQCTAQGLSIARHQAGIHTSVQHIRKTSVRRCEQKPQPLFFLKKKKR